MSDPEPGARTGQTDKERRLAEQLRRNLRRRKAPPATTPTSEEETEWTA